MSCSTLVHTAAAGPGHLASRDFFLSLHIASRVNCQKKYDIKTWNFKEDGVEETVYYQSNKKNKKCKKFIAKVNREWVWFLKVASDSKNKRNERKVFQIFNLCVEKRKKNSF